MLEEPPVPSSMQLSLFDEATPAAARLPPPGRSTPAQPLAPAAAVLPSSTPPSPLSEPPPPSGFLHPRAQREVLLGEHRVAFDLRRVRRRSIGFSVGPEGLTVSAPRWLALADVDRALREKAPWVLRKLQQQRERSSRLEAARIDWRHGAAIPFLGATVTLLLDPRASGAVLDAGGPQLSLRIGLPQDAAPAQLRDAVQSWLQRQARRVFEERCALFTARLGVRMKRLTLSSAATRWGSASADGSIRLNWRLVHFGLPVIDYVVTHELAHLREMNHSAAFWEVVRSVLPGFEQARAALRDPVLPDLG